LSTRVGNEEGRAGSGLISGELKNKPKDSKTTSKQTPAALALGFFFVCELCEQTILLA